MYNDKDGVILKVRNVYKAFKVGRRSQLVLRDVNFNVHRGELVSILGKSGSGKSTLLNIIAGLDRPSAGHVYIENRDIVYMSEEELTKLRREKIGFIFQEYNLINSLTVLENVILSLEARGIGLKDKRRKALRLLSIVGLKYAANKMPYNLSGGEKQRVAVARALAKNPRIILADEPTGALDSKSKIKVMNLILNLNKRFKTTFVIVTHDPEIAALTDRRIYIRDGRIFQEDHVYT